MLIKLNAKNQITLAKSLIQAVGPTNYFDVQAKDGQIVLTPVRLVAADAVRAKLAELGIIETDTSVAVDWARTQAPRLMAGSPSVTIVVRSLEETNPIH